MRLYHHMLIALGLAAQASAVHAYAFPDRGRAAVIDAAHVLPLSDLDALNREIVAWDKTTGHQLAVAIVPDLQGGDIKDYGYQLGRAWALGDKQRNDGAILLLAMKEHKVRIEVGYGLEPVLTDALTSEILAERVVPVLKSGDVPAALKSGAEAIMEVATPPPADQPQPVVAPAEPGFAGWWRAIAALGGIAGAIGGGIWFWVARENRDRRARIAEIERRRAEVQQPLRGDRLVGTPPTGGSGASVTPRTTTYVPVPTPSYDSGYRSPSYSPPDSSSPSSSWSSPSFGSGDSSSSSSSFDSGGGSFGGGGSDSSW